MNTYVLLLTSLCVASSLYADVAHKTNMQNAPITKSYKKTLITYGKPIIDTSCLLAGCAASAIYATSVLPHVYQKSGLFDSGVNITLFIMPALVAAWFSAKSLLFHVGDHINAPELQECIKEAKTVKRSYTLGCINVGLAALGSVLAIIYGNDLLRYRTINSAKTKFFQAAMAVSGLRLLFSAGRQAYGNVTAQPQTHDTKKA